MSFNVTGANINNILQGYTFFKEPKNHLDAKNNTISENEINMKLDEHAYLKSLSDGYDQLKNSDDDDGNLWFNNKQLTLADLEKTLLDYVKEKLGQENNMWANYTREKGDLMKVAVEKMDLFSIKILKALGLDTDKNDNNPLHIAASKLFGVMAPKGYGESKKMMQGLIALGYDVNAENKDGNTSVSIAAKQPVNGGSSIGLAVLIENDGDVNHQNNNGDTPLILSVSPDRPNYLSGGALDTSGVDLLLKNGADINMQNRNKDTALTTAAKALNVAAARTLKTNNADATITNNNNQTAESIVQQIKKNPGTWGNIFQNTSLISNYADNFLNILSENI